MFAASSGPKTPHNPAPCNNCNQQAARCGRGQRHAHSLHRARITRKTSTNNGRAKDAVFEKKKGEQRARGYSQTRLRDNKNE
eukprot:7226196-Lingulodinium_polyedra.AAC.1